MPKALQKKTLTDRTLKALLNNPAPVGKRYTVWDSMMSSFGARVTDTGSVTFLVMKRLDGKLKRWPIGRYPSRSLEDARKMARQYLDDIENGNDPKAKQEKLRRDGERRRRDTFSSVAEEFITKHVKTLRSAKDVESAIRRVFIMRWGNRPITEITRRDVLDVVDEFLSVNKRHTAHHLLAYLRKMFNWAIGRDIFGLESSPCDRIKPSDIVGRLEERKRVLTNLEIRHLWQASEKQGYPFGTLTKLLLHTGQRLREVSDMRWSEIDFVKSLWVIPASRMKKDSDHVVPLSAEVIKILENLPHWNNDTSHDVKKENLQSIEPKGVYVLSTTDGRRPISGFSKAKAEIDQLIRMEIELEQTSNQKTADQKFEIEAWRYHDIRRTMRTGLSALPIQDMVRELVISHTQKGMHRVYDRYAYVDEKRKALNLWSAMLRDIVSPQPDNVVAIRKIKRHKP